MEAAVVLPVFLFFVVGILLFGRILTVELSIERAMDQAARKAAVYGEVVPDSVEEKAGEKGGAAVDKALVLSMVEAEMLLEGVPYSYIKGGIAGINFLDSQVTNGEIDLVAKYTVPLPFTIFGKWAFPITQRVAVRRFTGYDITGDTWDGIFVYVTPTGTAYHKKVSCTYVNPSIRTVAATDLSGKRNKSGAKYKKCPLCKPSKSSFYYITDYGKNYHGNLSCSGLKRTVLRMDIEEAKKKYHPCSKCGK